MDYGREQEVSPVRVDEVDLTAPDVAEVPEESTVKSQSLSVPATGVSFVALLWSLYTRREAVKSEGWIGRRRRRLEGQVRRTRSC